jgi:hypothetical protein
MTTGCERFSFEGKISGCFMSAGFGLSRTVNPAYNFSAHLSSGVSPQA